MIREAQPARAPSLFSMVAVQLQDIIRRDYQQDNCVQAATF